MSDLITRLRMSWDADRSIISQTDTWMKERRDAADEIERLRNIVAQAIAVIDAVQTYEQPIDPTVENALTMGEHGVFDFDVDAARNDAGLHTKEGTDGTNT